MFLIQENFPGHALNKREKTANLTSVREMTLLEGITAAGKRKALRVTEEGDLNFEAQSPVPTETDGLKEGTDINGAQMPAGGTSARGWLSGIWKLIGDVYNTLLERLPPTLVGGRFPVDSAQSGTWDVGVSNLPALSNNKLPVEVTDASIKEVSLALEYIVEILARPLWVNPTNSNVNVNVANGTLPTVTTVSNVTAVSGVNNLNNLNLQPIQNTLMYSADRTTWALNVRTLIT